MHVWVDRGALEAMVRQREPRVILKVSHKSVSAIINRGTKAFQPSITEDEVDGYSVAQCNSNAKALAITIAEWRLAQDMDILELIDLALLANDRGNNGNLLLLGAAIPSRTNIVFLATRLGLTLRAQDFNILISLRNSSGKVSEWASLSSLSASGRMASRAAGKAHAPRPSEFGWEFVQGYRISA